MDDHIREFGMALGRSLLQQSWESAHGMLAPWMRGTMSVDDVRKFFEDEYLVTLHASQIDGMRYPEHPEPEVGGNTIMNATELRKPISWAGNKVRPLAPEVTDDNMKFWMRMQLQCSDQQMAELGFDFFCEVWMAIVDTPEGLRVGYWSHGAY